MIIRRVNRLGGSRGRRFIQFLSVVAVSSIFVACSSGIPPQDGSPSEVPILSKSPLDAYLPLTDGNSVEAIAARRIAENLIAQCMKDEGFEYTEPYLSDMDLKQGEGLSPSEWAATYGYGYAAGIKKYLAKDVAESTETSSQDRAYSLALYGPEIIETDEEEKPTYDWETQGCLGWAYHEATGGVDEVFREPDNAFILGEIDALALRVKNHKDMADIADDWSQCMADAGYLGLSTLTSAQEQALIWYQDIVSGTATDQSSPLTVEEAAQREIDLAIADLGCQESTKSASRAQQLRWQLEQELITKYPREVQSLKESWSQHQ